MRSEITEEDRALMPEGWEIRAIYALHDRCWECDIVRDHMRHAVGGRSREEALTNAVELAVKYDESAPVTTHEQASNNRDERQYQVGKWVERSFGPEVQTSVPERVERLYEEVCELAQVEQAIGARVHEALVRIVEIYDHGTFTKDSMAYFITNARTALETDRLSTICHRVYQKSVGDMAQEVGGISTTLLAYCEARGLSADSCERAELDRILALPSDHFKARQAAKVASGMAVTGFAERTPAAPGTSTAPPAGRRVDREALAAAIRAVPVVGGTTRLDGGDEYAVADAVFLSLPDCAATPDKADDREGVDRACRAFVGPAWDARSFQHADDYRARMRAALAALSTGNVEPGRQAEDIFGNFDEADYKPDLASVIAAEIMGLKWAHAPVSGEDDGDGEQMYHYGDVQEAVCRVLEVARTKTHSVYLGRSAPTPPVSPEPDSRAGVERPKIITLCGSSRFPDAFALANMHLSMRGHIVISLGCFGHADVPVGARHLTSDGDETAPEKQHLDQLHFRKIDISDGIFVVNPGGYIGSSTKREIAHAMAQGKSVEWMFPAAIQSAPIASAAAGPVGEDWRTLSFDDPRDEGLADALQVSTRKLTVQWRGDQQDPVIGWLRDDQGKPCVASSDRMHAAHQAIRATPTPAPHPVPAMEGQ